MSHILETVNGIGAESYAMPLPPMARPGCDEVPKPWPIVPLSELSTAHPKLRPVLIDGYLRLGETMNVIASPKVGKSWLVAGLAFAVANGREWMGARCSKGRVLLVDNELHPETLTDRLRRVADAMGETMGGLDVLSLRGQGADIHQLAGRFERLRPGDYSLIVLDAFYRFLPQGTNENDNCQMMHVYNLLDHIARQTGAGVAVVHHSSKGNQTNKAQTDVGSGAGTISRAADTHLTIRPHEEPGYFVLEAVTRSFKSPPALSVYFKYPAWEVSAIEASLAPERKSAQVDRDAETRKVLLAVLKADRWTPKTKIRELTGFGFDRIARGIRSLVEANQVATKRVKSKAHKGKAVDVYQLTVDVDALTNLV